MAAPIISEEGRGLKRRKKNKHRLSEPGALVIEHAEPSDAGRPHDCVTLYTVMVTAPLSLPVYSYFNLSLCLRCVYLRGVERRGGGHEECLRVSGLCGLVVGWAQPVGRRAGQRAALVGELVQRRSLSGGFGQGVSLVSHLPTFCLLVFFHVRCISFYL